MDDDDGCMHMALREDNVGYLCELKAGHDGVHRSLAGWWSTGDNWTTPVPKGPGPNAGYDMMKVADHVD